MREESLQWYLYDLSIYADWPIRLDTSNKWNFKAQTCSVADMSQRNVYLLKIGTKSFSDGSQDVCKDTESYLGPFALGFFD